MSSALGGPPTNQILAALPKAEHKRLLPNLERFPLVLGEMIYQPGDLIRHVYFPNSGIVSLLATVEDGSSLEVGIVGREGMVGMPVFMEAKTSRNGAVVQGTGSALRMKASVFRKECDTCRALPRLLQRYTHSLWIQLSQTAVCNRFHPIDARLARWLLMTRDRMGADEFQVTQEFLSNMLGVLREGVNKAAGSLQRRQLVRYNRGTLTILKRVALKAVACNCYQIIKDEYNGFLGTGPRKDSRNL
jgi:CRP-like cAMP-binding protein